MLSPWQRMMRARQQEIARQQRIEQAIQYQADRIYSTRYRDFGDDFPPMEHTEDLLPTTPATRLEWVIEDDPQFTARYRQWDHDLGPDQMQWQVEDELEKWADFVKDLKDRKHGR